MEASAQQVWTADQRNTKLAQSVSQMTKKGWRVESQGEFSTALVKGRRPNHILHLILSILTAGLWLFVWAGVAIFAGEKRRTLSVNAAGQVIF